MMKNTVQLHAKQSDERKGYITRMEECGVNVEESTSHGHGIKEGIEVEVCYDMAKTITAVSNCQQGESEKRICCAGRQGFVEVVITAKRTNATPIHLLLFPVPSYLSRSMYLDLNVSTTQRLPDPQQQLLCPKRTAGFSKGQGNSWSNRARIPLHLLCSQ